MTCDYTSLVYIVKSEQNKPQWRSWVVDTASQ
jgi:hypothetical protein